MLALLLVACAGKPETEETDAPAELVPDSTAVADSGTYPRPTGFELGMAAVYLVQDPQAPYVYAVFYEIVYGPPPLFYDDCAVVFPRPDPPTGTTDPTDTADTGTSPFPLADPGEVTVTLGGRPVALTEEAVGVHLAVLEAWPAGETLGFAIGGGALDPFSFPELLVVPAPPEAPPWPATIDRGADLVVTWTPTSDETELYVSGPLAEIVCRAENGVGTITVPAAALGHVGAGAGLIGLRRSVTAHVETETTLVQGSAVAVNAAGVTLE